MVLTGHSVDGLRDARTDTREAPVPVHRRGSMYASSGSQRGNSSDTCICGTCGNSTGLCTVSSTVSCDPTLKSINRLKRPLLTYF